MIEVGLGAFLDKVEEHFGKWVLRLFLVLVMGAVGIFCASIIWRAVAPVAHTVGGFGFWGTVLQVAWLAVGWIIGGAIATLVAGSLVRWQHIRSLKRTLRRAESLSRQTQELFDEKMDFADRRMAEINEMHAQSRALCEASTFLADEIKRLSGRSDDSLPTELED
jgi:hypothetical protein